MTWLEVAALIAKYGIPFVDRLLSNAQNNVPVTAEEWDSLKKTTPFDELVPKRPAP